MGLLPHAVAYAAESGDTFSELLRTYGVPALVVLGLAALTQVKPIAEGLSIVAAALVRVWRFVARRSSTDERRSLERRQRIARMLRTNLDFLEAELPWQRETFVDLRATLEEVDSVRSLRARIFSVRRVTTTRRSQSLSEALGGTKGHLVLLHGGPGSGKSVALRHYARSLLDQAESAKDPRSRLAIYVSLRDFAPERPTASNLRDYIEAFANNGNSPELATYFSDTFEDDLADGRVTILLDAFDEIPAVLGSTNIDPVVRPYVQAIMSLRGGSRATFLVASREYKDPKVPGWHRLQIVALSHAQQLLLLDRYGVDLERFPDLGDLLRDPRRGFATDLRSPLQLALLAEYVTSTHQLPHHPTELFDTYVRDSLSELMLETEADGTHMVSALEALAFELTESAENGLSASVDLLRKHLHDQVGTRAETSRLLTLTVESRLIARSRSPRKGVDAVSFAHRRLHEYFATRYVIAHPSSVPPHILATGGRWRETAVVLLQVGKTRDSARLLEEIQQGLDSALSLASQAPSAFAWEPQAVHLLEELIAAFAPNPEALLASIRGTAGQLVEIAWRYGTIADRKFALDCLPIIPQPLQEKVVDDAFSGRSHWLRTTSLRDCSLLSPLPSTLDQQIRRLLITLLTGGQLALDGRALDSDLERLHEEGSTLVRTRRLLRFTPTFVVALGAVKVAGDYAVGGLPFDLSSVRFEALYWILLPLGLFWVLQSSRPLSYGVSSRLSRFVIRVWRRIYGGKSEPDTAGLILGLVVSCILIALADVGTGLVVSFTKDVPHGLGAYSVRAVHAILALAWGPAILLAVANKWFSDRVAMREVALVVVTGAAKVATPVREGVREMLLPILLVLTGQAAFVGIIVGIFYLLKHYGGGIGRDAVLVVSSVFVAVVPGVIVLMAVREVRARRRVRRRLAARLDEDEVMSALCSLSDPLDASEYLRLLRVARTEEAAELSPVFVRELSQLIEAADGGNPQHDSRSATTNRAIISCIKNDQLGADKLRSWGSEVLDELGQLDEFLRARAS